MVGRFLICLASLSLAACGVTTSAPPLSSSTIAANQACIAPVGASTFVLDAKVLYAAELAYNIPAHAYKTANEAGQLSPALKARVRPLLVNADNALTLARLAYLAKNGAGFSCQLNAALEFSKQAAILLPKR